VVAVSKGFADCPGGSQQSWLQSKKKKNLPTATPRQSPKVLQIKK
jgi:hypothetical protein